MNGLDFPFLALPNCNPAIETASQEYRREKRMRFLSTTISHVWLIVIPVMRFFIYILFLLLAHFLTESPNLRLP